MHLNAFGFGFAFAFFFKQYMQTVRLHTVCVFGVCCSIGYAIRDAFIGAFDVCYMHTRFHGFRTQISFMLVMNL